MRIAFAFVVKQHLSGTYKIFSFMRRMYVDMLRPIHVYTRYTIYNIDTQSIRGYIRCAQSYRIKKCINSMCESCGGGSSSILHAWFWEIIKIFLCIYMYLYIFHNCNSPSGCLLFHYNGILGLHVARTDGLHGLAQQRRIFQADNLYQLRLLAGSALYHHLMHARRDGNRFQLIAVLHLDK